MSLRQDRKVAKRKQKQRQEQQERQRFQDNLARITKMMGLRDYWNQFREIDHSVLTRIFPRPRVVPDPASPTDQDLQAKCKSLRRALDRAAIKIGDDTLTYDDFHCVAYALREMIRLEGELLASRTRHNPLAPFVEPAMSFVRQYADEVEDEVDHVTYVFLTACSRLDGPIYTARRKVSFSGDRVEATTTLSRVQPESLLLEVDGVKRRAYRCGAPGLPREGENYWVDWDAEILDLDSPAWYPVYIQSHALDQMARRLHVPEDQQGFWHHVLFTSLDDPRLISSEDARYLVEVREPAGRKIGYLVAERLTDKVLVRTFLLPTMAGTPEATELHRRLRLRRSDIEYLGLADIDVLAGTDLLDDQEVVEVLRDCGCGDLISFVNHAYDGDRRLAHADYFKSYLRTSTRFRRGSAPGRSYLTLAEGTPASDTRSGAPTDPSGRPPDAAQEGSSAGGGDWDGEGPPPENPGRLSAAMRWISKNLNRLG